MSFLQTTSYTIEYELVCLAVATSPVVINLEQKVYKTLTWADNVGSCGQPLLTEEIAAIRLELTSAYQSLVRTYCDLFLDADTDLFILEHDHSKTYDNNLTLFKLHTWNTSTVNG